MPNTSAIQSEQPNEKQERNIKHIGKILGGRRLPAMIVVSVLLVLFGGCWKTSSSSFTAAEQAEVDRYISEHGRAAILRYLEVETQNFLKAVVPEIMKAGEQSEKSLVAVKETMALRDSIADQKLALKYVKYLASQGADVNAKGSFDIRIFGMTEEEMRFLAGPEERDSYSGVTPLHLATVCGFVDVAKFLVAEGADVNVTFDYGLTPLHVAAFRGNVDTVQSLASLKADINAKSYFGMTPLHMAAVMENVDIAKILISQQADVTAKTDDATTPLHLLAAVGNIEVVKFLVSQGANVHAKDDGGTTPLYLAARNENVEVAKFLVSKGADVKAKDQDGSTPLNLAAMTNPNVDVVKFLVSEGSDVNANSVYGTPLHEATWNKNIEVVKYLVSKGADVNARDVMGKTPLHNAASYNKNIEVVKFLVTQGADVSGKDKNGKTPLDHARENKNTAVVEYLSGIAEQIAKERREAFRGSKAGERKVLTIKDVEYAFRWCPPGTFMMGSPESEEFHLNDEKQHRVSLSKGFWMLETEVTQEMWESVGVIPSWYMGANPSKFKGKKLPVDRVSWNDCQEFIGKLNEITAGMKGIHAYNDGTGRFTLPTEAQWEYACRAGTTTPYYFGSDWQQLEHYAWYSGHKDDEAWGNSKEYTDKVFSKWGFTTHPVGTKRANAWGLYDMHGNVWEWCDDRYGTYPDGAVTAPVGPSTGTDRVSRGGGWDSAAWLCRSAIRYWFAPSNRGNDLGFRLSLVGE